MRRWQNIIMNIIIPREVGVLNQHTATAIWLRLNAGFNYQRFVCLPVVNLEFYLIPWFPKFLKVTQGSSRLLKGTKGYPRSLKAQFHELACSSVILCLSSSQELRSACLFSLFYQGETITFRQREAKRDLKIWREGRRGFTLISRLLFEHLYENIGQTYCRCSYLF